MTDEKEVFVEKMTKALKERKAAFKKAKCEVFGYYSDKQIRSEQKQHRERIRKKG